MSTKCTCWCMSAPFSSLAPKNFSFSTQVITVGLARRSRNCWLDSSSPSCLPAGTPRLPWGLSASSSSITGLNLWIVWLDVWWDLSLCCSSTLRGSPKSPYSAWTNRLKLYTTWPCAANTQWESPTENVSWWGPPLPSSCITSTKIQPPLDRIIGRFWVSILMIFDFSWWFCFDFGFICYIRETKNDRTTFRRHPNIVFLFNSIQLPRRRKTPSQSIQICEFRAVPIFFAATLAIPSNCIRCVQDHQQI